MVKLGLRIILCFLELLNDFLKLLSKNSHTHDVVISPHVILLKQPPDRDLYMDCRAVNRKKELTFVFYD